ncbi:hypothetical protein AALO_G00274040 [Alosa alosa]|uniref:Uncharacterized protein n=1 Tax=Alosa alosa TaxID=278164 RepID=A0AAV6FM86_9TELE|nr:hypothetical protein AALO_G00274040 [Alosa alosa]
MKGVKRYDSGREEKSFTQGRTATSTCCKQPPKSCSLVDLRGTSGRLISQSGRPVSCTEGCHGRRGGPQCSLLLTCDCAVELDFKQQEDKLQPLMKRLCPTDDSPFPSLPYSHEAFTSTPKRKAKAEAKKHGRWKLWFL